MIFVLLTEQSSPDYIPQLISVLGTLMGAIAGWLLTLVTNNIGKLHIYLDEFNEQKSNNNEYSYIAKVFFYNASYKPESVRNLRFAFAKCRLKVLFTSMPGEGKCSFETVSIKKENKADLITINSHGQSMYIFSDLIDEANFEKLSKVRKIYLVYENKRNHTKKRLIKKNFDIATVSKSKTVSFL